MHLAAAEAADAEEDETFGKDKRGDEMPDWASDKEKRLAKIQEAMTALEAEAKLAAEEERRIEAEKEQQRNAEGRKKPGKPAAPPSDEPDPKAQRNFTDPQPHYEVEWASPKPITHSGRRRRGPDAAPGGCSRRRTSTALPRPP